MGFNVNSLIENKSVGNGFVGGIDEYTREDGKKTFNFTFSKINEENGNPVLDKHRVFIPVSFFFGEVGELFKKALESAFADAPKVKAKLDEINAEKLAKLAEKEVKKQKDEEYKKRKLAREVRNAKEDYEDIKDSYDLNNLPISIKKRVEKIKEFLRENDKDSYNLYFGSVPVESKPVEA